MYRENIKFFATGLLTATFIIGSYYYVTEDKQDQVEEIPFKELKAASQKLGYTLVDNKELLETKQEKVEADTPMEEKESTSIILTISSGMRSEDVESILKEQKIISESDSLSSYMIKNDLARKIQIGEFIVTKEMSLEQIAKTITN